MRQNSFITNRKYYRKYDAINNCKSAGIIPYTFYNDKLYFLFQQLNDTTKNNNKGWNDFGGKKINDLESTIEIASREFNEETSCLFYIKEIENNEFFDLFKNNYDLKYDESTIQLLNKIIPEATSYFISKMRKINLLIHVSSKETYISYFLKVNFIDAGDIPNAEDIHINYKDKYLRSCRWFSIDEILEMPDTEFHKRLQITKIKERLKNYYEKNLFI